MSELVFVRHGETAWNDAGRIQGWAPVPLNDRGVEQAAVVADTLAELGGIDAVVSSDLRRARETAAPIAEAADVEVEIDGRLRERDFGTYQGLDADSFFERFPEMDLLESGEAAARRVPESGESWVDVRERVREAVNDLRERDGRTVVVTHVNPIRLVVGDIGDRGIVDALTDQRVRNATVTRVATDGKRPELVAVDRALDAR